MPMNLGLGLGLGSRGDTFWWLSGSELDLDFANNRAFNRSTGFNGSPNGILTYTSPSPKLVYGDDGVLGYAPHNQMLRSQEFNDPAWTKAQATITANSMSAPDGTLTADTLTDASGQPFAELRYDSNAFVAGTWYTFSLFVKAGTKQHVQLALHSTYFGANKGTYFHLDNGTLDNLPGITQSSITAIGDGWYRCAISALATSSGTGRAYIYPMNDAGDSILYTGTGTGTLYLWGAQLSLGATLFDYIPTTTAAVYSIPIDHNPTTFAPLGVLIEEQRTNLLLQSQTFATTWATQRCTVTSDAALGGDGTQTADAFVEDSAYGSHQLYQTVTKAASSIQYALSVEVEPQNRTWCRLQASTGGEVNYASTWFNLSGSGSVGTSNTSGAGFTNNSSSITLLPNGRYKLVLVFTSDTHTSVTVGIRSAESDGSAAYVGNSLTAFYLWGAQLEAGAFPTSYIPTVASQVTRAADQVSILTSAFGYNETAGSLLAEVRASDLSVSRRIAVLYNDASNRIALNLDNGSQLFVRTAGSTVASVDGGTFTVGQDDKVAVAFTTDDYAATVDGAAVGTDTAGTMPSGITVLQIGHQAGIEQTNGHIKRLTYFPTRKTNAELQALSA